MPLESTEGVLKGTEHRYGHINFMPVALQLFDLLFLVGDMLLRLRCGDWPRLDAHVRVSTSATPPLRLSSRAEPGNPTRSFAQALRRDQKEPRRAGAQGFQ